MTQPYHSATKDDWGTPWSFFNLLNDEFHFTLDPCASAENHKCESYYTQTHDGLQQPWPGVVFVNPPYSRWEQWVGKGYEEAKKGATVVFLLAARTDTKAFHRYFWNKELHRPYAGVEIRFIKGRLCFEGAESSAPFPSMLVIFKFNEPTSPKDQTP